MALPPGGPVQVTAWLCLYMCIYIHTQPLAWGVRAGDIIFLCQRMTTQHGLLEQVGMRLVAVMATLHTGVCQLEAHMQWWSDLMNIMILGQVRKKQLHIQAGSVVLQAALLCCTGRF